MKKEYLKLEKGKDQLKIPKLMANGANFRFDFNTKELSSSLNDKRIELSSYFISKDLVNAINAAIITGRPLLLKGEPGCGKTKLAKAVAAYFYGDQFSQYYFEWHVKSRSNSKEGAYVYDHVSRLRDATIADKDNRDNIKAKNPSNYIELGPMGLAFVVKPPTGKLPILLIDEIDKGDIDFPNDLLLELDEMRFAISELDMDNKYIAANEERRPLVFITSNDERELPPAFLRRCLFYRIPPFEASLLEKIANSKLEDFYEEFDNGKASEKIPEKEVTEIVKKFLSIKDNVSNAKPPSTSELLDWLKMITYQVNKEGVKVADIIEDKKLQALALKLMS